MSRATECDDVEACGQGDAGRSCTDASTFDLLSTERINSYIYDLFRFHHSGVFGVVDSSRSLPDLDITVVLLQLPPR